MTPDIMYERKAMNKIINDYPLVSILIPSFNSEEYLANTLNSCLNQSYKNIEIIVVDDGSTDNSLAIAYEYVKKYSSIKVYFQKNIGAPSARNFAFENSNGEYIQYLDADDILDQEKIAMQIKKLKNEDEKSVIFGSCKMFETSIEESTPYLTSVCMNYDDPQKFLLDLWGSATMVLPHSWLVPRSIIKKVGSWNEQLLKNQDGVFFAKVVHQSSKVIFAEDSLVYYRTHNLNSVSRKKSSQSEASRLKSFLEYERLFVGKLEHDEVKRALAVVYSYFIFDNYPNNFTLVDHAQKKIESFGFKEPINVNITLYKKLSPLFGIYGAIRIHKNLSKVKQVMKQIIGRI